MTTKPGSHAAQWPQLPLVAWQYTCANVQL
jgi:hypothetical protein